MLMSSFCSEAYYTFFSTLASRTRLCIIDALNEGPKTIAELSNTIGQEEIITSRNVNQLSKCVLVFSQGEGDEKRYSLNKEIISPLSHLMSLHTKKYCPGLTECVSREKLKEYLKKEAAKPMYVEHE